MGYDQLYNNFLSEKKNKRTWFCTMNNWEALLPWAVKGSFHFLFWILTSSSHCQKSKCLFYNLLVINTLTVVLMWISVITNDVRIFTRYLGFFLLFISFVLFFYWLGDFYFFSGICGFHILIFELLYYFRSNFVILYPVNSMCWECEELASPLGSIIFSYWALLV